MAKVYVPAGKAPVMPINESSFPLPSVMTSTAPDETTPPQRHWALPEP